MNRILILGQSSGVYELALALKNAQPSSEISIFSLDGQMPHNQNLLADYIAKKISKDQVLCAGKDFYKTNHVELILDQKLERISLRQKKITTESCLSGRQAKEHVKFDTLVIAGAPEYRWPEIKGIQKQGVHHAQSLGSVEAFYQQLPFARSIVMELYDWDDLKIALALKAWGKEVDVIIPHETRMAQMIEHEVCEMMMKSFQDSAWNVYYGRSIEEVLGDSETKAVRLSAGLSAACPADGGGKAGKVLAADLLIMGNVQPRLRLLDDLAAPEAVSIDVNADFQTQAPNVYAFGDVIKNDQVRYWNLRPEDLKAQAEQVANAIFELPLTPSLKKEGGLSREKIFPLFAKEGVGGVPYVVDLPNWFLKVTGDVTPAANVMTFRQWNPETRVYQKVFIRDGQIQGAVLINQPDIDPSWAQAAQEDKSGEDKFSLAQTVF